MNNKHIDLRVDFPNLGYVEQFIRLKCAGDILNTGKGPKNVSQISRMFGAWVAYKRYVDGWASKDSKYQSCQIVTSNEYMKTFLDHMLNPLGWISSLFGKKKVSRVVLVKDMKDSEPAIIFNLDGIKTRKPKDRVEIKLFKDHEVIGDDGVILNAFQDKKILSDYRVSVVERFGD